MAIHEKDIDVYQLLKKLKDANGAYPQELLASRRQKYLTHIAQIGGGAGLAAALKNTAQNGGKAVGLPPAAGTLLESLLVVAIVAEAGTVTYLYRDKIKEVFRSISNSPKVEQVVNPPVLSSPIPGLEITLTPVASETEVLTETVTPEVTPSLLAEQPTNVTGGQGSGSSTSSGGSSSAVSTPAAPRGNNGNQYGHTPIPQRTKEPGNNSNNNNTDQNPNNPNRPNH
jgi:hypothetical protein